MQTTPCYRLILLLGLLTFVGSTANAQLVFTVTATANATVEGYTSGNSYTFIFTTGSSYPAISNLSGSYFQPTQNYWIEDVVGDNQLFLTVGGTALGGGFIRPTSSSNDPYSYISNYTTGNGFNIAARNNGSYSVGLTTLNSTALGGVAGTLSSVGLNSASYPQSYIDMTTYFGAHLGSYSASGTISVYSPVLSNLASFTATNLTIASAVPEPSTYAAIFGGLALMGTVLVRRRQRIA
jgi:hypothetical protein